MRQGGDRSGSGAARFAALVALSILCGPRPAAADPFSNDDLFVGRSVKQTVATRRAEFGIRFEIAPVRAYAKGAVQEYRAQHPEYGEVFTYLDAIDAARLKDAGADQIRTTLLDIDGLTATDRQVIDATFAQAPADELAAAVQVVNIYAGIMSDNEEAISFSLAPYAIVNFDVLQLWAELPMAGFVMGGDTDFTVGNLGLDVRFGHTFGESVTFGLSYGVALHFPTAGERALALGLQNVLGRHRFSYRLLTLAPYVALGLDVGIVKIQAHLEFLDYFGVRGDPAHTVRVAFRWGTSVILSIGDVFAVTLEVDGAHSLKDAGSFAAIYLTPGLRGDIFGFKIGAAVQVPLDVVSGDGLDSAGAIAGSTADINAMLTLGYAF